METDAGERLVPWHDPPHPDEVERLEELAGVDLDERTKKYLGAGVGDGENSASRFHVVKTRYIFGAILIPELLRKEDRVVYHEVDVILTAESFVTLRKKHPTAAKPFDPGILLESYPEGAGPSSGEMFYRLMEDVSQAYEDLIQGIQDEIDELEAAIGLASDDRLHVRYSGLRRDLVEARRNISPLIRALRAIQDERLDIRDQIFPEATELLVKDVLDDLERIEQTIPLVADLLSGVRDYHQSRMAQRQNDIVQNLTVIASLLLVPTLIVGVYGQNFRSIPETQWSFGYAFSWLLILLVTIVQLIFFKKVGWLGQKKSKPEEGADLGTVLKDDGAGRP